MIGTVRKFTERGFGFIRPDEGQGTEFPRDVFFHISDVVGRPQEVPEGVRCFFEVGESAKGPQAYCVEVAEG